MPINSNNYPLVSVIMNCYNGQIYLAEAVKSVLSQTYENFEVIFWDNQSKDKSAIIYKSIKDIRLKYYYANKHTSLYKARNLAIQKAKGRYIAFLDTDDLWAKEKLALQIKKFKNKKISLVYSNYYILNQFIGLKKIFYKKKLPEGIIYKQLLKDYFVGICTVIMKKNFFIDNRYLFNSKYNIIGDFALFTKISKKFYFGSIQEPLSIYRKHNKSFSNKNYLTHIKELKFWYYNQTTFDSNSLQHIKEKIFYMEAMLSIFNKEFFLSINKIRALTSLKNKIKLLSFLMIPNFIFKKFMNNF
jgi:glycosyltransferase involved in cell wall biosynthesis